MKHINFKRLLMLFAVIIVIQNGSIVVHNTDPDSYSEEGGVSPLSDLPSTDDDHT